MATEIILWDRNHGELARKQNLPMPPPRGLEVIITEGSRVLLFCDGVFEVALSCGRYPLPSHMGKLFRAKSAPHVTLIWVDDTPIVETFLFQNIRTCDNIPLEVALRITFEIKTPALFWKSLMKEKESYHSHELKSHLFDALRGGVEAFLAVRPIIAVSSSRSFQDALEVSIRSHLCHSLSRDGLSMVDIRSVAFYNPDVEALKDFAGAFVVARQQARIKLEHDKAALEEEHALEMFRVEHRHGVAQVTREIELEGQRHKTDLELELLRATLRRQMTAVVGEESLKDRKLKGEMGRKKYQVATEAEVAKTAMETQRRRAQLALEIQEKIAALEYKKAQYRLRLEVMRSKPKNNSKS